MSQKLVTEPSDIHQMLPYKASKIEVSSEKQTAVKPEPPQNPAHKNLLAEQVYVHQVAYLYVHLPYAFVGSALLASILLGLNEALWMEPVALVWASFILLASLLQFGLWRSYQKIEYSSETTPLWSQRFLFGTLVSAVGWGVAGFLFFPSEVPLQQFLIPLFLVGVAACAVPLLAALRRMLWVALPIIVVPLAIQLLTNPLMASHFGAEFIWKIAVVTFCLSVMLMAFGYGLFYALIADFRHLAQQATQGKALRQTQKQVESLQKKLTEVSTQKDKIEYELNLAKVVGESANMAKGEFLATMSHEIRTPLNGVIPLLDLLRETGLNVEQRDYVETAYKSSQHLLRIIDDILDYSKIEAGKLELENVELSLRELVQSVVDMMAANAKKKGVTLEINLPSEVPTAVRGDPVRLRQVLANLISNSIKFTQRGQVVIQIKPRQSTRTTIELLYTVRDSGVGMSQAAVKKLFKPFTQADASTTRIHGGTGLGLVICKRLIDLMGGEIGVKSKPGKGSVFWFVISQRKSTRDIPAARKDLDGAKVLLLQGPNKLLQQQIMGYLANWKMAYDYTNNPSEILNKLKTSAALGESWGYDVVLLDTTPTTLMGLQLVKDIRNLSQLAAVHILILTEPGEMDADLSNLDNTEPLYKPLEEQTLRRKLYEILDVAPEEETLVSDLLLFSKEESDMPLPSLKASETATSSAMDLTLDTKAKAASEDEEKPTGKILLVEDNPVNQRVAKKLLARLGMEVTAVDNGQKAVDVLEKTPCDIVLMDCQMPVMDGYQATQTIREKNLGGPERIPIIAMTANAMAGDREKCLAAGMDDYMTKPLKRSLLEKTLHTWLTEVKKRQTKALAVPLKETDALVLRGKVLLVEDNPVNQRVAKKLLSRLGVEPLTADNGKEALDVLQKNACDMVLMDCQMPVMDGYEATRALRAVEASKGQPHLPIIAVTANKMAGDREKCLNCGMDDYLTKPLKRDNLEKTLLKWLPDPNQDSDNKQGEEEMSVLDASIIEELYDVMEEEFVDLLQDFLKDAPNLLTQMRDAIRDQKIEDLLRPAHSLKSSAANVGAMALSELAKSLEAKARDGSLKGTPDQFRQAVEEFKKAGQELKGICARGKP